MKTIDSVSWMTVGIPMFVSIELALRLFYKVRKSSKKWLSISQYEHV